MRNVQGVQSSSNIITKLRFGDNELKFMDESSAMTLPSPLDVLDNSITADNSSAMSISDFRMEYKDLAELGKLNCFDVGCQQENVNQTDENQDCTASSPLLEPLLTKQLNTNETSTFTLPSRPYLYGKQLHSHTNKNGDVGVSPKAENGTPMKNPSHPSSNIPVPHHAHYDHHFKESKTLPHYILSDKTNSTASSTNGVMPSQQQLTKLEPLTCNNLPTVLNQSSQMPPGTLPNVSIVRSHKQKCSSVDGNFIFSISLYKVDFKI
jgi:hypothetical protein